MANVGMQRVQGMQMPGGMQGMYGGMQGMHGGMQGMQMQGGMPGVMQGMQPGMGNYNQQAYPNQQIGMPQMIQQTGMGNANYGCQPQQQPQQDNNPFF